MNNRWLCSGLTLMELLLTLFVLSVLTVVVIPAAGNVISTWEARSFVLQLEADIAYAQKRAMATEQPVRLNVNRVGLYMLSEPDGVLRRTIKSVRFPDSLSVVNNLEVTFQPHATFAGQSNGGTVYVKYKGQDYAEIRVSLLSNRTRVIWH